ncbi:peptidylprolyl isomerase [Rossellomorea sp. BNER]|jgi:peptidyl-prolyl cis-trans isomerase B (cyclophilin B)|nr:peptidylprolyl isomerase [Rossellomorea sp. BNER]
MKRFTYLFFIMLITVVITACGQSDKNKTENESSGNKKGDVTYPQLTNEVLENEKAVVMKTNMGDIKIKLFPEHAPKAVENFITHSKEGYYEGVTFHRVIRDFMIQGGDPGGTGTGGESIWGEPFEDEFSKELYNLRGALSMANAGEDTNGSQFFIVQNSSVDESLKDQMEEAGFPKEIIKAYMEKGGTPHLDNKHTVFGQVIEGMDVVDKIANVETGEGDKPVEDVIIEKIEVVKK